MSREFIGKIMLGGFVLAIVSFSLWGFGWLAVIAIAASLVMGGWVLVAVNLMTGHRPFEL